MTDLWAELGTSMRSLRTASGLSLRQVEAASGKGRGTLSQIENGKARPNRDIVEWYDAELGADGLLVSIFAEARGAHRLEDRAPYAQRVIDGDDIKVGETFPATGQLVRRGAAVTLGWTLANTGCVEWSGRRLRRVGAHAAARLITSARTVDIPDCTPGESVQVRAEIQVPHLAGTVAAYWRIVDEAEQACFTTQVMLAAVLLVR